MDEKVYYPEPIEPEVRPMTVSVAIEICRVPTVDYLQRHIDRGETSDR
jgi:hypothetical protein